MTCRLSAVLEGRLIRAMLLAMITADLNFSWARNTPTRLVAAPRVLLRTTNVLPRACLCTHVRGVILTALSATSRGTWLGLTTLRRVLHNGCRQGLTPLSRAFGRKLSCLLVLIVGWARTTWPTDPDRRVRMVPVIVRQAPLALVGLTLKMTAPVLTVLMHCPRPSAPVWTVPLWAERTPVASSREGDDEWLACNTDIECLIVLGARVRLACRTDNTLVTIRLVRLTLAILLSRRTLPLCISMLMLVKLPLNRCRPLLPVLSRVITGRAPGMMTASDIMVLVVEGWPTWAVIVLAGC